MRKPLLVAALVILVFLDLSVVPMALDAFQQAALLSSIGPESGWLFVLALPVLVVAAVLSLRTVVVVRALRRPSTVQRQS